MDGWSVDGWTSIDPDLLIGHPVDDAVISGVHVPQVIGDDDDGKGQDDHQPQHDVEDHSILKVILIGQVIGAAWVTLQGQQRKDGRNGVRGSRRKQERAEFILV